MHFSPTRTAAVTLRSFDFSSDWLHFVDDCLIVANKPSGLLSVPGRGEDKQECLLSHLQSHYPEARIVHRLDMDTSGLMVLARDPDTHRHLSRQFEQRRTQKTYEAICLGKPLQTSGQIKLPMRCDWENRPRQMIDFFHGKYAETNWQLTEQYTDSFKVLLTPITGRSHQLRLHMQSLGHPILGDNLYADARSLSMAPRLMLHARLLAFEHPHEQRWMTFECAADFEEMA
jgi:tRNA pseudouridine32 synthase/23S rRNA pseudouridine746 synthase